MNVIALVTQRAHLSMPIVPALPGMVPFSRYPVMESAFWQGLFELAQNHQFARAILAELDLMEDEPCFDHDRVCRNIIAVREQAERSARQLH